MSIHWIGLKSIICFQFQQSKKKKKRREMKMRIYLYVMLHYCFVEYGSHYFVLVYRQQALCMQKKLRAEKHVTIVESLLKMPMSSSSFYFILIFIYCSV